MTRPADAVALPTPVERSTETAFGLLARLRGAPALHPRGVTMAGTAYLAGPGLAFADRTPCDVLGRFSRGIGLRSSLPDVNGLAVRFVDAFGPGRHHDLLWSSIAPERLSPRLLWPQVDVTATPLSSILSYELDGVRVVLLARVQGAGLTFDALSRTTDPITVELSVRSGRTERVAGHVVLDRRAEDPDLRFDPVTNRAPRLAPVGVLQALRRPAYRASRARAPGPSPDPS